VLSGSKRVITCTSSKTAEPKFRFYLEVIYNSKTYAYTFRPNNLDYGQIDISSILQSIVFPTSTQEVLTVPQAIEGSGTTNEFKQNIHSIPHKKYTGGVYVDQFLSTGGSSATRVEVKLYDFYATSSSTAPVKVGGSTDGYFYLLHGYNISTDLINYSFDDFKLGSTTKKFISGNYNPISTTRCDIDVALTDYGTLALLNRTDDVNDSAETQYITIKYYNTSNVLTDTQVFTNSNTNGGQYNASGVTDDSMIIYFGCYPANLDKLPASYDRPQDQTDLSYYEVYASSVSGVTAYSKKYRFNIVSKCEKYDRQTLTYINKFGVWEYISFDKKRTDNISNSKTEIKKSIYDYTKAYATVTSGYNEKPFVPNVAHESRKNVSTNVKQTFTINTGFLDAYKIEQVKDMFISSKISYINSDGSALAVILTNSSIEEVVVSHKYEQTEYALNFEYSIETYNPILL
tara:strand:+ start:18852 stop:20228 length:1377 start_codon:yes stop_codon:yes gene_type:complete